MGEVLKAIGRGFEPFESDEVEQAFVDVQAGDQSDEVERVLGLRHVARSPFDAAVQITNDTFDGIEYDDEGVIYYRGLYHPR